MTYKKLITIIIFTSFLLGVIAWADSYPQIDIAGHKRWFYSNLQIAPTSNYYPALDNSLFLPNYSTGPWTEELRLSLGGKVDKDWSVNFVMKQDPLLVDRYDARVTFNNYSLLFGSPDKVFTGQEFILQDHASGIGLGARWKSLKLALFLSGNYLNNVNSNYTGDYSSFLLQRNPDYTGQRAFSSHIDDPQKEFKGFELDRLDINQASLKVFLAGHELFEGSEFYFVQKQGLVLISQAALNDEVIKIEYETISGFKHEKHFDSQEDGQRRVFLIDSFRILEEGEVVTVDGIRLERDMDYFINYGTGLIVLAKPLNESAEVRIDYNYSYGFSLYDSEIFTNYSGTFLFLLHDYLVRGSETVTKNNDLLTNGTDYTIDYEDGYLNFADRITTSDTIEVSYSYYGIKQDVAAANVEYELSDWSKIGCSISSITPSTRSEARFDAISPASFLIGNLYNRTVINQDSYLQAELALSNANPDYRTASSVEADSALKIFGRTKLGPVLIDGTYRKTGENFASTRKVRNLTNWQEESLATTLNYDLLHNLQAKNGYIISRSKAGDNFYDENKINVLLLEFLYKPLSFWNIDLQWRRKYAERPSLLTYTTGLHSSINLTSLWPVLNGFSEKVELIYKDANIIQNGAEVSGTLEVVPVDESTYQKGIGLLSKYKYGFSTFVNYKMEGGQNNVTGIEYSRTTPYLKLAYKFVFTEGFSFELYADRSVASQTSETSYKKVDTTTGLVLNIPCDNPLLDEFKLGGSLKSTDYQDRDDAANNYFSNLMEVFGSMVF